ncbi:hypothetical protein BJY04DRAFT_94905 [Aspergillus karnatakaensis]|uniref:uncharacterized protein n=1 Tax=Aspergillus karnatakaensis TaxID=1810916 RepID=UPI003CCCCA93
MAGTIDIAASFLPAGLGPTFLLFQQSLYGRRHDRCSRLCRSCLPWSCPFFPCLLANDQIKTDSTRSIDAPQIHSSSCSLDYCKSRTRPYTQYRR